LPPRSSLNAALFRCPHVTISLASPPNTPFSSYPLCHPAHVRAVQGGTKPQFPSRVTPGETAHVLPSRPPPPLPPPPAPAAASAAALPSRKHSSFFSRGAQSVRRQTQLPSPPSARCFQTASFSRFAGRARVTNQPPHELPPPSHPRCTRSPSASTAEDCTAQLKRQPLP
jgi:hypothetical protein